jgi:amidohydrolase family protein
MDRVGIDTEVLSLSTPNVYFVESRAQCFRTSAGWSGTRGGTVPYLMERKDSGWRDFAGCRVNIDQPPPSFYFKRLYYDTVTFSQHNLRMLPDIVGAEHMTMGSDYPHLLGSIEKAVTSIEGMDFSAAEKERIFSGNAMSIMNNVRTAVGCGALRVRLPY